MGKGGPSHVFHEQCKDCGFGLCRCECLCGYCYKGFLDHIRPKLKCPTRFSAGPGQICRHCDQSFMKHYPVHYKCPTTFKIPPAGFKQPRERQ